MMWVKQQKQKWKEQRKTWFIYNEGEIMHEAMQVSVKAEPEALKQIDNKQRVR